MENQKNERGVLLPGIILIIIGLAFLLPTFGVGTQSDLWPAFILAPGLGFLSLYIASADRVKNAGLLIPGFITTLSSIFFFVLNGVGWAKKSYLWPVFPFIVGVSFYAFYLARGKKDRGILLPANILLLVGVLFLALGTFSFKLWPAILIVAGLAMIVLDRKPKVISKDCGEKPEE